MDAGTVLKQYFGHDGFRPGQEELVDAILAGRDVLGVMPTGGGKSLCYQIPALLLPGLTLVISPLISLMKDQVNALTRAGVPAAFLNSSLSAAQFRTTCARAREGHYKLLYIAPERLEADGFQALLRERPISLVAVDEAHCVSQWGQDFRPSYLKIAGFIASLPCRPVVGAFTATATAQVRQDILRLLQLEDPVCAVTGFDRSNLFFDVQRPQDKLSTLLELVQARADKSGIVYCATRAGVEQVCAALCKHGVNATRYHAGLDEAERRANQEDFQFDRAAVMVATNAFGMGIDKSNVSFVIHYNMPKSLEAYYQEAGRAGRDGAPAQCFLLYAPKDVTTARFLIKHSPAEDLDPQALAQVRQQDYQRLEAMVGYCSTTRCLRGYLLDYFGQAHTGACGNCGNCLGDRPLQDITVPAQMVLSCVVRIRERLGYYVGQALVVRVLRGSKDQRIRELGLESLSTYGLMAQRSAQQVRALVETLKTEGYLCLVPQHLTLEPTTAASAILFGGKRLVLPMADEPQGRPVREHPTRPQPADLSPQEDALFSALKELRTQIAREEGVPAYLVFSNATLADMAAKTPTTTEEFLTVSGVGQVKAKQYATRFLAAIAACRQG